MPVVGNVCLPDPILSEDGGVKLHTFSYPIISHYVVPETISSLATIVLFAVLLLSSLQ